MIDSAFNHFKIRGSRSNEGIKRCLNLMITSGIKGVITVNDLTTEDYSRPDFLVALKLELARLEFIRKNQKKPEEYNTLPLPSAHLSGITFTRNTILERILKFLSANEKETSSNMNTQNSSASTTERTARPLLKPAPTMVSKSTQTKKEAADKLKLAPPSAYLSKKQKLSEANDAVAAMKISKLSKTYSDLKNFNYFQNILRCIEPNTSRSSASLSSTPIQSTETVTAIDEDAMVSGSSSSSSSSSGAPVAPLVFPAHLSIDSGTKKTNDSLKASFPDGNEIEGDVLESKPPGHPYHFIGNKNKKFCVCQRAATSAQYIRCIVGAGQNKYYHIKRKIVYLKLL